MSVSSQTMSCRFQIAHTLRFNLGILFQPLSSHNSNLPELVACAKKGWRTTHVLVSGYEGEREDAEGMVVVSGPKVSVVFLS